MNIVEILTKKRDGFHLSEKEIRWTIDQYVSGSIPDYQMSALLMAIYFKGMERDEIVAMSKSMIESGDQIDLQVGRGDQERGRFCRRTGGAQHLSEPDGSGVESEQDDS